MKRGKTLINVNDIIGKRLGKLRVVCYANSKYDITLGGARKRHFYICECDCGRHKFVQRGPLLNDIVHSCGCSVKTRTKRRK